MEESAQGVRRQPVYLEVYRFQSELTPVVRDLDMTTVHELENPYVLGNRHPGQLGESADLHGPTFDARGQIKHRLVFLVLEVPALRLFEAVGGRFSIQPVAFGLCGRPLLQRQR